MNTVQVTTLTDADWANKPKEKVATFDDFRQLFKGHSRPQRNLEEQFTNKTRENWAFRITTQRTKLVAANSQHEGNGTRQPCEKSNGLYSSGTYAPMTALF